MKTDAYKENSAQATLAGNAQCGLSADEVRARLARVGLDFDLNQAPR